MDLRQLRYFITIVEAGSFSRAAERLHVAQPALSQHVLAMEAELNATLLHRSVRGVQPTEAGIRMLDEARAIQTRIDALRDRVAGREAYPTGEVRFGMPGTVSEQVGVSLVEVAQAHLPGVSLRITEAMSGFVLSWLREGAIDLALLFDVADMKGLTRHEILTEDIALFASAATTKALKGENITLQAALRLPLIVPGPSHGLRALIDACALSIGASLHPTVEIDSYRQIKHLVVRGSVFGLLPMAAINDEVSGGIIRGWRLTRPAVRRRVFLVYRTDKPLSTASQAIAQLLWSILRNKVHSGEWLARWTGSERLALQP